MLQPWITKAINHDRTVYAESLSSKISQHREKIDINFSTKRRVHSNELTDPVLTFAPLLPEKVQFSKRTTAD
jgi:hypothetical protein